MGARCPNPNIAPARRNVRPSGFDANDLRRSRSGLALSKVRKHCIETSARETSLAEVLMERARECSCNKQDKKIWPFVVVFSILDAEVIRHDRQNILKQCRQRRNGYH